MDKDFSGDFQKPLNSNGNSISPKLNLKSSNTSNNVISEDSTTVVEDSLLHKSSLDNSFDRSLVKNGPTSISEKLDGEIIQTFRVADRVEEATSSDELVDQSNTGLDSSTDVGSNIENFSSQGTFCNHIENLKMGRARGRPKKKTRSCKNPFDIGL